MNIEVLETIYLLLFILILFNSKLTFNFPFLRESL